MYIYLRKKEAEYSIHKLCYFYSYPKRIVLLKFMSYERLRVSKFTPKAEWY